MGSNIKDKCCIDSKVLVCSERALVPACKSLAVPPSPSSPLPPLLAFFCPAPVHPTGHIHPRPNGRRAPSYSPAPSVQSPHLLFISLKMGPCRWSGR